MAKLELQSVRNTVQIAKTYLSRISVLISGMKFTIGLISESSLSQPFGRCALRSFDLIHSWNFERNPSFNLILREHIVLVPLSMFKDISFCFLINTGQLFLPLFQLDVSLYYPDPVVGLTINMATKYTNQWFNPVGYFED